MVLGQLSLSAWLPAAFFTLSLAMIVQFRRQGTLDLPAAAGALTEDRLTLLLLALPVLVSATLLIQAFSFEAIRTLEGYWHRRGPATVLRTLLIWRHLRRKRRLRERRIKASHRAFLSARAAWLAKQPSVIVDALERIAIEEDAPDLTDDEEARLAHLQWWAFSDPWLVAKVEHLVAAEGEYPRDSRILPTRLGNVLRATEDRLQHAGQDLEGFALRRRGLVSRRVLEQHDQFRTRLDMYSILTLTSACLVIVAPLLLVGSTATGWQPWIAALTAGFGLTCWASYSAAIASARGYLTALRQFDHATDSAASGS